MEKLLMAIERMHAGEVSSVTMDRLAYNVLIDAAVSARKAEVTYLILSVACELRSHRTLPARQFWDRCGAKLTKKRPGRQPAPQRPSW